MKHFFTIALFTLLISTTYAAVVAVNTEDLSKPAGFVSAHGVQFSGMENLTYEDFLNHKPRELAEMTGQKLSFKDRFVIRLVQRKLRKAEKKGLSMEEAMQESASGWSWNWIAAILGVFLSLIGVLISWLVWGRSGLWSSLIAAVVVGLILIPILA